MNWRSTHAHWGVLAKTFHWLVALGIFALAAIGLYMVGMPLGLAKLKMYLLHKALGITVLALVLLRLLWRLFDRHPRYPPGMPRWQMGVAHASHALLYLLLLAVPISGWVYNSASGFPLPWFGLVDLPAIAPVSKPLAHLALTVHETAFWTLAALVLLHAAAAIEHHVRQRDAVLARMLPWRTRRAHAISDGENP
ncbi:MULTISPECIES: cytochrome b/b6 domain-containing protein [Metallibacterium]|jgi:cytochrome b561|uniref:cytochrome b n=1 Tax=Metallibacterium TaxID=1218803 RepID=UPI00261C5DEC|nr:MULTISPECIES: cytochrome b/b6 domain-containing protein [Metallibacterium]MBW8074127.1 cytochrome b [Metallibacterium scheffleri]